MTLHSNVPYALDLFMKLSAEIIGSVYTIICGVALHCHSCNHGLLLKLYLGHDGLLRRKGDLMKHTDIADGYIKEDSAYLVELRCELGSYLPKQY